MALLTLFSQSGSLYLPVFPYFCSVFLPTPVLPPTVIEQHLTCLKSSGFPLLLHGGIILLFLSINTFLCFFQMLSAASFLYSLSDSYCSNKPCVCWLKKCTLYVTAKNTQMRALEPSLAAEEGNAKVKRTMILSHNLLLHVPNLLPGSHSHLQSEYLNFIFKMF